MPTLSIYIGENQISAMRYNTPEDFAFTSYPYVFPYEVLKHDYNEKKFYDQVIKMFGKEFGIDLKGYKILVSTVGGYELPFKSDSNTGIFSALSTINNYEWVFAESFFVAKPSGFLGYFPYGKGSAFNDLELQNYFSNLGIYPQFKTLNPKLLNANDMLLQNISANVKHKFKEEKAIILTGSRFTAVSDLPISTYLFAFSLFNEPGLYRLKLDPGNKLPLISLVNKEYFKDETGKKSAGVLSDDIMTINEDEIFDDEFIDLGTLLKAKGNVEVLLEVDSGNSQFISLKENQIFVFPLERMTSARVVISGASVGKRETYVKGGKLGLVVDTRTTPVERLEKEWIKVIEERLTAF